MRDPLEKALGMELPEDLTIVQCINLRAMVEAAYNDQSARDFCADRMEGKINQGFDINNTSTRTVLTDEQKARLAEKLLA